MFTSFYPDSQLYLARTTSCAYEQLIHRHVECCIKWHEAVYSQERTTQRLHILSATQTIVTHYLST